MNILITALIVSGINALLALLLVIAERFLANYGTCKITINEKEKLDVEGGRSLLASLKEEKIFLPSACGGRGTCAYCKCQISDGAGPVLPTEEALLTAEEIQDQTRLACQVKVKSNLDISIPEELFNIKEFKAKVDRLQDLTYDIKLLRLQLLQPNQINFISGQYVQLESQPYEKVKESVSRAYSIASSNSKKTHIDLMIRLVPEGICTTWVHNYLKEGDELIFTGPMGDFRIHDGVGEIIMVAGGSGMAPMVSLLHELTRNQSKRKITYFFGAVARRDLFYLDEMKDFKRSLSNFTFIPALSKPLPEDNWKGVGGLITVPLENYMKEIKADDAQIYICGSPGLINACGQVLKKHDVTEDRIYFDPFA